jgi:hypothetical protein
MVNCPERNEFDSDPVHQGFNESASAELCPFLGTNRCGYDLPKERDSFYRMSSSLFCRSDQRQYFTLQRQIRPSWNCWHIANKQSRGSRTCRALKSRGVLDRVLSPAGIALILFSFQFRATKRK